MMKPGRWLPPAPEFTGYFGGPRTVNKVRDRRAWIVWALIFVLAAVGAGSKPVQEINRAVAAWAAPWGRTYPSFNVIWVLGGLPLTFFFVVWLGGRRRRRAVFLFFVGGLLELLFKHGVSLPMPHAVFAPPPYPALIRYSNVDPGTLLAFLHSGYGRAAPAGLAFFHGTFPSGHVFRLVYTAGIVLGPRRSAWLWPVAAVSAFAVVATGGHWVWDTVGGLALARGLLLWAF